MPKAEKTLQDLFHDALKDLYFTEKKILAVLPKMAKAAHSEQLSAAFEKHRQETEAHIQRLEEVFDLIDENPKGKKSPAIIGILDEGSELMKEYKRTAALDAGLVAAAQVVEHYEICRYGTLRTWARMLGLQQAVGLLQSTLQEEEATDQALTKLAESAINQEAQPQAA